MKVRCLLVGVVVVLCAIFMGISVRADYVTVDLAELKAYNADTGKSEDARAAVAEPRLKKCFECVYNPDNPVPFLFGPADANNSIQLKGAQTVEVVLGDYAGWYSAVHMALFARGRTFNPGDDTVPMWFVYKDGSKDKAALTKDGPITDWCEGGPEPIDRVLPPEPVRPRLDHRVYPCDPTEVLTKITLPVREDWPVVEIFAITLEGKTLKMPVEPSGKLAITWGGIKGWH